MLRKAQVSLQVLLVIGGLIIVAAGLYFALSGLVQRQQEVVEGGHNATYDLLGYEFRETSGTILKSPLLWPSQAYRFRTNVSVRNPYFKQVTGVLVVSGSQLASGSKKGTVFGAYLDEAGLVEIPVYEDVVSSGCNYNPQDSVAFKATVPPMFTRVFHIFSNDEYFGNQSCFSLIKDPVYLYSESQGCLETTLVGSFDFSFLGEGLVNGSSGDMTLPNGSCSLPDCFLNSSVPGNASLDSSSATLSFCGDLVFREGTVFPQERTLFFPVPECAVSFNFTLVNHESTGNSVSILDPFGNAAVGENTYRGFILGASSTVSDTVTVQSPGVWSAVLGKNVSLFLSNNLPNDSLALSQATLFVPGLVNPCPLLTVIDTESDERPDASPPVINSSLIRPFFNASGEKPDTSDSINVTLLAWDAENPLHVCSVSTDSGRCINGCEMFPDDLEYDSNTEAVFADLGSLPNGSRGVFLSCTDVYGNTVYDTQTVSVFLAEDTRAPEFVLVSGQPITLSPSEPSNFDNINFSAQLVDTLSPIKTCEFFIQGFSDKVEMTPFLGQYTLDKEMSVWTNFSSLPTLNSTTKVYSATAACEDILGNRNSSSRLFQVFDGNPPVVKSVSVDPPQAVTSYANVGDNITFNVSADDDALMKNCSISYQTSPGSGYTPPVEMTCSLGCGSDASNYTHTVYSMGETTGSYDVLFNCSDQRGNSVSSNQTIKLRDVNAPLILNFSVSPLEPDNSTNVVLWANVTDDGGVDTCLLRVFDVASGQKIKTHTMGNSSVNFSTTFGTHVVDDMESVSDWVYNTTLSYNATSSVQTTTASGLVVEGVSSMQLETDFTTATDGRGVISQVFSEIDLSSWANETLSFWFNSTPEYSGSGFLLAFAVSEGSSYYSWYVDDVPGSEGAAAQNGYRVSLPLSQSPDLSVGGPLNWTKATAFSFAMDDSPDSLAATVTAYLDDARLESGLADGSYKAIIWCNDSSNTSSDSEDVLFFKIDSAGPAISDLSLDTGLVVNVVDYPVGVDRCNFSVSNPSQSGSLTKQGDQYYNVSVSLSDSFTLTVRCNDTRGKQSSFVYESLDTGFVNITPLNPGNDESILFNVTPNVSFSEGGKWVDSCRLVAKKGSSSVLDTWMVKNWSNFAYLWSNPSGVSGTLDVNVTCVDDAGFSNTSLSSVVLTDVLAPEVGDVSYLPLSPDGDTWINFSVFVSEKGSGVSSCNMSLDNATFDYPLVKGSVKYWNLSKLALGEYNLTARCVDFDSNTGFSQNNVSILVSDESPPSISGFSMTGGACENSLTFATVTVTDSGGAGVANCSFSQAGSGISGCLGVTSLDEFFNCTFNALLGTQTVTSECFDASSNSVSATKTYVSQPAASSAVFDNSFCAGGDIGDSAPNLSVSTDGDGCDFLESGTLCSNVLWCKKLLSAGSHTVTADCTHSVCGGSASDTCSFTIVT